MARHRNLKFVSVDSTKLETNLEKKLGLKPFDGSHQLVHFTRYNVTAKSKVRLDVLCVCWGKGGCRKLSHGGRQISQPCSLLS